MSTDPFALSRPPDLVVGDLRLWIVNRQFPDNQDYWDGNWLDVRAIVKRGTTSVQATGTILHLGDISRFLAELKTLSADLVGTASLSPLEPNLKAVLSGDGRGQIQCVIQATPDHLAESHEFRDGFDQTFLPTIIGACRSILEQYPIRGR
jgi:hypothetical protein